jgi:hypothetical protein
MIHVARDLEVDYEYSVDAAELQSSNASLCSEARKKTTTCHRRNSCRAYTFTGSTKGMLNARYLGHVQCEVFKKINQYFLSTNA